MKQVALGCLLIALTMGWLEAAAQKPLPDWALGPFVRPVDGNPVLLPDSSRRFRDPMTGEQLAWEAGDVFNPAAIVRDGKICVLYRAEDRSGVGIGKRTSRIGLAETRDGIHLTKGKAPVLFPDQDTQKGNEWPGGCEDPRVAVTEDGLYVMFYTQWNRKVARLAVATSRDLKQWTKHGPVFEKAYNGRFKDMFCKSGSILTELKDGQLVIARHQGEYLMYWGERFVNLARSKDLIHWTPDLDEKGELKALVRPRPGFFDSDLTECGPPALLTDKGILLLYNGKNRGDHQRDFGYTAHTYAAGQLLFDRDDPERLLERLDQPFFIPTAAFEKSGQYPAGTVFIEGLVFFNHKWFLYYGCADSRVAVAVYDPATH
ncbi:glycoside hydrolase family 130 protein [Niabella terrae]